MPIEVRNDIGGDQIMADYAAGQSQADQNIRMRQYLHDQQVQDTVNAEDRAQNRHRENFEWEYTAQQRRIHDKLAEDRATIMGLDYLTPDERQNALHQLDAKQAGIQPVLRLRERPVELGGRKEGEIFSQGGFLYSVERDKTGRPIYVKKGEDREYETNKDRVAKFDAAVKYATVDDPSSVGGKKFDQARFDQAMQMLNNGPKGPQVSPGQVVTIKSESEYDALPSGTLFVSPDGQTRRKP